MGFNNLIKATIKDKLYPSLNMYSSIFTESKKYKLKIGSFCKEENIGKQYTIFDCIHEQLMCELYYERKFNERN
jgi:hypothetical protein